MTEKAEYYIPTSIGEVDQYVALIEDNNVNMIAFDTERCVDDKLLHKSRVMLLQLAFCVIDPNGKHCAHVALIHFKRTRNGYRIDLMTSELRCILTSARIIKVGINAHNDAMHILETFPSVAMTAVVDLQDTTMALGYGRLGAANMCDRMVTKHEDMLSVSGSKLKTTGRADLVWENDIADEDFMYAANDVLIVLDIWNSIYGSIMIYPKQSLTNTTISQAERLKMLHINKVAQNIDSSRISNIRANIQVPIADNATSHDITISAVDVKQVSQYLHNTCKKQNITKIDSAIKVIVNGYGPWATIPKSLRGRMAMDAFDAMADNGTVQKSPYTDTFTWSNKR